MLNTINVSLIKNMYMTVREYYTIYICNLLN